MLLLSLLLATASAAPEHVFDGAISADLRHGAITEHEALWLSYLQMFEPDELPDQYREERYGWLCGTVVVQQLSLHWDEFTPAEQNRINRVITPRHGNLGAAFDAHPAPPPASDICWGRQGQNVFRSEHFQIEYDGGFSQSQADGFARAFETSYDTELGAGWREPDGMDRYLLQVYVQPNNGWAGGYTSISGCGQTLMPYIVVGSGSFFGTWFNTLAAHEFNHASQYAYGFGNQFWFWEATATYVEESVYPSRNDWADPIESGFSSNPWVGMHASDQDDQTIFWHMYGMSVWNFYLDEHYGGSDFVLQMWEESEKFDVSPSDPYVLTQDEIFESMGYDFEEAYEGFIVNNVVMDFREQDDFAAVAIEDEIDRLPDDAESDPDTSPQSRGQNYWWFDPDEANNEFPDLVVNFDGDRDGEWVAYLVGVEDDQVVDQVRFVLEDEEGTARLEDIEQFDDVYMVVSPMVIDDVPDEQYEYDWEADVSEKLKGSGLLGLGVCGCSSGTSTGGWLLLVMPLLLLRRKR